MNVIVGWWRFIKNNRRAYRVATAKELMSFKPVLSLTSKYSMLARWLKSMASTDTQSLMSKIC